MAESIILTNSGTLILTIISMFALIISWFLKNQTLSAVLSVGSFLGVIACIIYSLLLGASLTEVLILVLVFVALNAFSFLPKGENKPQFKEGAERLDKPGADSSKDEGEEGK